MKEYFAIESGSHLKNGIFVSCPSVVRAYARIIEACKKSGGAAAKGISDTSYMGRQLLSLVPRDYDTLADQFEDKSSNDFRASKSPFVANSEPHCQESASEFGKVGVQHPQQGRPISNMPFSSPFWWISAQPTGIERV